MPVRHRWLARRSPLRPSMGPSPDSTHPMRHRLWTRPACSRRAGQATAMPREVKGEPEFDLSACLVLLLSRSGCMANDHGPRRVRIVLHRATLTALVADSYA